LLQLLILCPSRDFHIAATSTIAANTDQKPHPAGLRHIKFRTAEDRDYGVKRMELKSQEGLDFLVQNSLQQS
jgi:hypothetical protein